MLCDLIPGTCVRLRVPCVTYMFLVCSCDLGVCLGACVFGRVLSSGLGCVCFYFARLLLFFVVHKRRWKRRWRRRGADGTEYKRSLKWRLPAAGSHVISTTLRAKTSTYHGITYTRQDYCSCSYLHPPLLVR